MKAELAEQRASLCDRMLGTIEAMQSTLRSGDRAGGNAIVDLPNPLSARRVN
jgi:hypothetical protein